MSSGAANRQLPEPVMQRKGINVLEGDYSVKEYGSWNIPQDLNDTHTIPGQQDFRSSSTAPGIYSLGYQHATPSDLSSFSSKGMGYGSVGTRTATPGPQGAGSMHLMQTPRSIEEMSPYSYDGDGDVVMQDLEDLKAIMDVMHHVHEKRFKDEQLYQREVSSSKPVASLARIDKPSFIFVIDTSFILSHLHLVEAIVSLHDIYGSVVLVPWATIQELDGLRKSTGRIITTAFVGLAASRYNPSKATRTVEVSRLARQAVNWQLKMFQQVHKGVWGQKREECIDMHSCGDDAILDCARYFKEIRGFVTVLLSDDRNLCVKARVYELLTTSFDPGVTHTARAILDKTAAEVKTVQPHLSYEPTMPSPRSPPAPYLPAYRQTSPLTQSYTSTYTMADKDAHMEDAPMPMTPSPSRPTTHNSSPIIDSRNSSPSLSYSRYSSPGQLPPTSRFSPIHLPNPQLLVSARPIEPSMDMDREIRGSVYHLLERAFKDIMNAVPALMHYRALSSFGGEVYNLEYLKIDLRKAQNLEQIEQDLSKHWHTIFNEVLSYDIGIKVKEGRLSQPYHNWSEWAGNRPGTKPRKMELKTWIADWTSLWKNLYNKTIQTYQLEILSDERLDWHKTEKWSRQLEMIAL